MKHKKIRKRIIALFALVFTLFFTFSSMCAVYAADNDDTVSSSSDRRFSLYLNLVKDATYFNAITIRTSAGSINYEVCDYMTEFYPNKTIENTTVPSDISSIGYKVNGQFYTAPVEITESGNYKIIVCRYYVENGVSKPLNTPIETFNITVDIEFTPQISKEDFYVEHYINADDFINELKHAFDNVNPDDIRLINETSLRVIYADVYKTHVDKTNYSLVFVYLNVEFIEEINILSIQNADTSLYVTDPNVLFKNIYSSKYFFNISNIRDITTSTTASQFLDSFINVQSKLNYSNAQNISISYGGGQVSRLNSSIAIIPNVSYTVIDSVTALNENLSVECWSYPLENLYLTYRNAFTPEIVLDDDIQIPVNANQNQISNILSNHIKDLYLFVNISAGEQGRDYSYPSEYYSITTDTTFDSIGDNKVKFTLKIDIPTSSTTIHLEKEFEIDVMVVNNNKPKILTKYNKIVLTDIADKTYQTEQVRVININGKFVTNVEYELIEDITNGFIIITAIDTDGSESVLKVPYVFEAKEEGFRKFLISYGNFLRSIF